MNFLVDADVIIGLLRRYPPAVAWESTHKGAKTAIPSIVIMEIQQGC